MSETNRKKRDSFSGWLMVGQAALQLIGTGEALADRDFQSVWLRLLCAAFATRLAAFYFEPKGAP